MTCFVKVNLSEVLLSNEFNTLMVLKAVVMFILNEVMRNEAAIYGGGKLLLLLGVVVIREGL